MPLTVKSETSLESSLAQHMFSAFMWAIARDVPPEQIDFQDQTSVGHADKFLPDSVETLLSVRLENKVLTGMATAIQRTGLGTLQDAYMCIIPPLSCAKKLPVEAVIDFVRQKTRDDEVLGRWEKIVPVYRELFQISKTFGIKHRVLHKATAILIEVFRSIITTLEQRRTDEVETLTKLKDELLKDLNSLQEPDSSINLMNGFAGLYSIQHRRDPGIWDELVPSAASGDDNLDRIHQMFTHPQIFSEIMSIKDGNMKSIEPKYVNVIDILGRSPLHYAAVRGDVKVIRKLIKIGADPKATDLAEWTPLHYAIEKMKEKKTQQQNSLVEEEKEKEGRVEEEEDREVVWALLQGGVDIEIRGRDGIGCLHCAARSSSAKLTNLLLEAGASNEIQDNSRRTPLHWAAYTGCDKVVDVLLSKGVNRAARDDYGRTAVHLAAITGREKSIALLLGTEGVETDARDRDRRTALHLAAENGHEATFRLLLEKGADIQAKDGSDWTPLHLAAEKGHEATVRLLLEKSADIHAKDGSDWTPLHLAAARGHEATVRLLLEKGADIHAKDGGDRTPLHLAAANGHEATVRLLLEKGADIHAKDGSGWTPLHLAAARGHEVTVRLLLEKGADIHAKDGGDLTPLHLAAAMGHKATVRLLK